MDTVFVLTVFCVFAACVLLVLMLGAGTYKGIRERSREGYDRRACLSYIWTKVKNTDVSDSVHIGAFQGMPVLYLEEAYDGVAFRTMIYLYDGWVRELFSEAELEFTPESGMPLFEAEELSFELSDEGLIKITLDLESLLIFPRCRTELIPME